MTPRFAARRRAEEFHSLVEGTSTEGLGSARHADVLELVSTLRAAAPVEPRPEFVADLRQQLMAEAATVLTPTAARLTLTPRRDRRERRIALAIGGFAVVSATTSMAMAAQSALPGDTLYPLKRALEDASTTIQIDEDAKGASLLAHAAGRLDEVDELTKQRDEPSAEAVADTLHTFTDQASTASDLIVAAYTDEGEQSDIEELRTFTARSMSALDDLETVVPDTARAALIEAAQVINLIDSTAIRLCPSCGDGGAQVPSFEPASVDELLGGLGRALGPLDTAKPAPSPGKDAQAGGRAPRVSDDTEPTQPTQQPTQQPAPGAGEPAQPVDFPEPATGDAQPDQDTTADGGGRGGRNLIEDLTDRLTGGGRTPTGNPADHPADHQADNRPDTLGEVLDETVGGIVKGLLGP
jgi:hypothetical protein